MTPSALILGITGQDGWFLSGLLLTKGYSVFGTSRDFRVAASRMGDTPVTQKGVHQINFDPCCFNSIKAAIELSQPSEVYIFSGQTSVGVSFEQPHETITSLTLPLLHILEIVRQSNRDIRIFHASSTEVFGSAGEECISELHPHRPASPYALGKSLATQNAKWFRDEYGVKVVNGFLSNHESVRRNSNFVLPKIINSAISMKRGTTQSLKLGNLDVHRDWGHARDFVEAIWKVTIAHTADDYIISTGTLMSLKDVVNIVFNHFELDVSKVSSTRKLMRENEPKGNCFANNKIWEQVGWLPSLVGPQLITALCEEYVQNSNRVEERL